jgi:hypothetical protein
MFGSTRGVGSACATEMNELNYRSCIYHSPPFFHSHPWVLLVYRSKSSYLIRSDYNIAVGTEQKLAMCMGAQLKLQSAVHT